MVEDQKSQCLNNLSPQKSFIVKAYIEWILHNDLNLKMNVLSEEFKIEAPENFIKNNLLNLTISRNTIADFNMRDGLTLKLRYENNFNNFVNIEFPAELVTEIYIDHDDKTKTSFDLNYFETDLSKYKLNGIKRELRLVV